MLPSRPLAALAGLARACHPGPTVAVTAITALLAWSVGHGLGRGALVTAAVGAGQLGIGWSNDLLDAARDRQVGRRDKPVALGQLSRGILRVAVVVSVAACVVLSLLCGWASGLVHLLLLVGSGWAYNLGLKRMVLSPVAYAVAFGALPAVVTLALRPAEVPPVWMMVTGALLGVGAHLLNALPDLEDDETTGVRGLPHRLGRDRVRLLAPLVLTTASAVTVWGPPGGVPAWAWAAFGLCLLLALAAALGRARLPFLAAIGIAGLDVLSLLLRS